MYEARQNKEKVSRRIDGDGMVRQRVRIRSNKSNDGRTVQMLRTYVIEDLGLFGKIKHTRLTEDALTIHARALVTTTQPDSGFAELHSAINNAATNPINPVALNENLMLVSHGAPPFKSSGPIFGNYTPAELANILSVRIIPVGYAGEIYLNGCNTAKGESDSFAFQLKLELIHAGFANVKVKGNLNTVFTTHRYGIDYSNINEDDENRFLINMQGYAHTLIGTPNAVSGSGRYESGICMTKIF